jgi:hypothetical protein
LVIQEQISCPDNVVRPPGVRPVPSVTCHNQIYIAERFILEKVETREKGGKSDQV